MLSLGPGVILKVLDLPIHLIFTQQYLTKVDPVTIFIFEMSKLRHSNSSGEGADSNPLGTPPLESKL